jgi:hypothetical protein
VRCPSANRNGYAAQQPRGARCQLIGSHQTDQRLASGSNQDLLAGRGAIDQAGELRFGFVDARNLGHIGTRRKNGYGLLTL